MAISSPGIGSNLDINTIVGQLMQVEATPLTALTKKEVSYQAKLTAYGNLSGALGSFQNALSGLTTASKFQALSASAGDSTIFSATTASTASTGLYNVNVTQLAQAQTLMTSGRASSTAPVAGTGTITFQFGTVGGNYAKSGGTLSASVATNGIAANSLSINGTAIATGASTNSGQALAAQINLATGTTGVTATAQATDSGAIAFSDVTTDVGDSYVLKVGGVEIANIGESASLTAGDLDSLIAGADLASQGITASGSATDGTLRFTRADGANIEIEQTLGGTASGGVDGIAGSGSQVFTASVALSSASGFTVAGSDPTLAGLSAGTATQGADSFTQDASQATGTVTIGSNDTSLQGIRDAINKANIGVKASIISDGSSAPYRLVLTSAKTGATSSMKISVDGSSDLANLLGYEPTDNTAKKLTETSVARNTVLTVNGITINSATNNVTDAIQGVTLNVQKVGTSTLNVTRDTGSITSAVNAFVKAFNETNTTLKSLTAYNAETKQGGPLLGDSTVRSVQTGIRNMLATPIDELTGPIKTLSDIGVRIQRDGSLSVDSSKLQTAINNNANDIAGLFAAIGNTSDSLVTYSNSTLKTQPGKYAVNITAIATQGALSGVKALNTGTTTIAADTEIKVTLDGNTASVDLTAGTYTGAQLAAMLQSAINGKSTFTGSGSSVSAVIDKDSGVLKLTSTRYGSASNINITSGTGTPVAELLGASVPSANKTDGVDVAGSIGGMPAIGSGQFLTGGEGTPVDGLKLQITGATGDRGDIEFARGYAFLLNSLIDSYTASKGLIASRKDGINASIKEIGEQRDKLNTRLAATEKRYRAQFTALDVTMSNMTKTSSYLTQQLASLASLSSQ